MTEGEARAFLSRLFAALLDPEVSAADVAAFFAPDYEQLADGKRLDRAAFVDHAQVLKATLDGGTVTLEKVVASDSTIASLHLVTAYKKSGETVRVKVHAFFEIKDGLIVRTEELTHLVEGAAADRDLGSRTSH